eukprot:TRINITY_DN976_c0_g1_i14.p3 TRINITY_DN976_c0_g1~~TRINITY_DN976_c0_g1_i14.p3  ORF type:complete len:103 (-),score=11.65 TRINITY_DN976_c0_g1_i14:808-1116(-)
MGISLDKSKTRYPRPSPNALLHNQIPGMSLNWKEEQNQALDTIKNDHLYMDSSKVTAASHLVREHKGTKYLMGFDSHTYTATQSNYSTPKQEFFAIWKAMKT